MKFSSKRSDIIFLIGQNNTGKSTFLRAYEFFTNSKQKATLDDFYKELYNALSMNVCSEYVQGIISGFKYNIKIMEESKNEQSYASAN